MQVSPSAHAATSRPPWRDARTAKAMAPTKTGRPDLPCTSVSPVFGVVEAVAGVVRLGNDRIEGAAVERRVHLVGHLFEAAAQDGERDRIKRAHFGAFNY